MRQDMSTRERWIVALETLIAIGAYAGAVALLAGVMDFGTLTASLPWGSTALAGMALGLCIGVFPTLVVMLALRRPGTMRTGHLLVGLTLCGWILLQVAFIGLSFWLQSAVFVWGAVILFLAWGMDSGAVQSDEADSQRPIRLPSGSVK